ncbi:MAG: PQQ-dependent sugar dehydrogenase [Hyphomonadaceae bacterium]
MVQDAAAGGDCNAYGGISRRPESRSVKGSAMAAGWRSAGLILLALVVFGAGVVTGHAGSESLFFWKTRMYAQDSIHRLLQGDRLQTTKWKPLESTLQSLETVRFSLGRFETSGGAIEAVGDAVLYATPTGGFGELTPAGEIRPVDLQLPMNREGLLANPLVSDPAFDLDSFRVLDLAVRETGPDVYEIFVSHDRFAGSCFEWVISSTHLKIDDGVLRPVTGRWRDVFTAQPCIPPKKSGWLFAGEEGGGRMVFKDAHTLLVSIGDHQFDGDNDPRRWALDPTVDYGKILEIDIATGRSRHVASGLRNPQGLYLAKDGRLWESEHGPFAGDELNLIRNGESYGWPNVTYGIAYGKPRRPWPGGDPSADANDYAPPAYAWMPSIGAGQIVEADPLQFPNWRNRLILSSLRANALFVIREDQGVVRQIERIQLSGARIRDATTLRDGRLALLMDGGDVMLVRNAEIASSTDRAIVVTGLPLEESKTKKVSTPLAAASHGEQLFKARCASCHTTQMAKGAAPALAGVVGRRKASLEGYPYSAGLISRGGVWSRADLQAYLTDPSGFAPGTTMPKPGISWQMVPAIIDYMANAPTQHASN